MVQFLYNSRRSKSNCLMHVEWYKYFKPSTWWGNQICCNELNSDNSINCIPIKKITRKNMLSFRRVFFCLLLSHHYLIGEIQKGTWNKDPILESFYTKPNLFYFCYGKPWSQSWIFQRQDFSFFLKCTIFFFNYFLSYRVFSVS